MHTGVDIEGTVRRLVECFNGAPISSLTELPERELIINSSILVEDRRSNTLPKEALAALIRACRSRFPDIQFQCESVTQSNEGFISQWTGYSQPEGQRREVLSVPCSCRVKYAGKFMRELWFSVSEYSILQQLGKVCAAPGQSSGNSASVNTQAMERLKSAIVMRNKVLDLLGPQIEMHVNVETYLDITKGLGVETYRLDGVGKLDELLAYVWERFCSPVDISFKNGISQGHTTTFRGTIRSRIGGEMQRYNIVCGFVSPRDQVSECWLNITPPPTLMECFS